MICIVACGSSASTSCWTPDTGATKEGGGGGGGDRYWRAMMKMVIVVLMVKWGSDGSQMTAGEQSLTIPVKRYKQRGIQTREMRDQPVPASGGERIPGSVSSSLGIQVVSQSLELWVSKWSDESCR